MQSCSRQAILRGMSVPKVFGDLSYQFRYRLSGSISICNLIIHRELRNRKLGNEDSKSFTALVSKVETVFFFSISKVTRFLPDEIKIPFFRSPISLVSRLQKLDCGNR